MNARAVELTEQAHPDPEVDLPPSKTRLFALAARLGRLWFEWPGADPHTHRHVVAFNASWDDTKGRMKAAEFTPLVLERPYWQAVFHI